MIEITGKHNTAIVYTDELEDSAREQIQAMTELEGFSDSKIRVMPDVHTGMGSTIGTTMTITDKVVPGMVGVDIGCGMETVEIEEREIDFEKLDALIRREIPAGFHIRKKAHPYHTDIDLNALKIRDKVKLDRAKLSIGTLGGGNHFIEVAKADDGRLFIVVHSGSRHLGSEVAMHYQKEAVKAQRANQAIQKHHAYVEGALFDDYMHDMTLVQRFAKLNRKAMIDIILQGMDLTPVEEFTTVHNYIEADTMILRKGAVSAKKGEKLLIPINMRDGSLVCEGKGNDDWNQSAPHGAGRLLSRTEARDVLRLDEFKEQMKGVYTTSVSQRTLDEAPAAYKDAEDIIKHISPTAEILFRIKPVYNFKSG